MSDDLQTLYRETILDHSRRPRGAGLQESFAAEVHHVNPVCGDEVTLRVQLTDGGHSVARVSHESKGCSISVASTSVMAAAVDGRSVADMLAAYDAFHALVTGATATGATATGATATGATATGAASMAATGDTSTPGGSGPGSAGAALESLVTDEDDPLADAQAFAGVARYPARVKCALLGWSALRAALVEATSTNPTSTNPTSTDPSLSPT